MSTLRVAHTYIKGFEHKIHGKHGLHAQNFKSQNRHKKWAKIVTTSFQVQTGLVTNLVGKKKRMDSKRTRLPFRQLGHCRP